MRISTARTAALGAAVLFGTLLLTFAACTPRGRSSVQDAPDSVPEYVFDVDPELLGDTLLIDGAAIALAPPRGWDPVDDATRAMVEAQIQQSVAEGPISGTLLELFVDPGSGSALTLMRLDGGLSPREIGAALGQAEGAEKAVFRHAGLEIVQIRTVADQAAAFSLVTRIDRQGDPLLLQYVVAQTAEPQTMRAVESSIGSLRVQ